MKKIYLFMLLAISTASINAQSLVVTLDSDEICAGETITATVRGPEIPLNSPAADNNNNRGIMFDLVGVEGAIIKGFTTNVLTPVGVSIEVYYRTGSFVGFEDSNVGWTLLGSSTGIPMGTGVDIGVELDQVILAGQTLGFYVTCSGAGEDIFYATSLNEVGDELASNQYLTLNTGVGKEYPFGVTYEKRDFIGSVIYEPIVTDIVWNGNTSTTETADFTLTQSGAIIATGMYGGFERKGGALITVNDYEVNAMATPSVLGWDESSTLSAEVTQKKGLGTSFQAGNGNTGAMFDITATNALSVNGITVYTEDAGTPVVEVFFKTGTFVGSEANAGAWTSLGTTTALTAGDASYIALSSSISVAPGQTIGLYVTRTDANNVFYTNGTGVGNVVAMDDNLTIKEGKGVSYPFGAVNNNRILNTVVHYEVENPAGLTYSWAPGGASSASVVVTPNGDVTYTVTVGDGDCEATGDAAVSMALGIEDALAESISVYPNPASDAITIQAEQSMDVQQIVLLDVSGKIVFSTAPTTAFTTATIPVSHLAKGMYVLQLNVNANLTNRKVIVE